MDRKKHTLIVETIYETVAVTKNEDGSMSRGLDLAVHTSQFTGDNYSAALADARREQDRVIRYGLSYSSGGILKSVFHPSAIKQVGLVDLDKYEEEVKAAAYDKLQESNDSINDVQSESQTPSDSIQSGQGE